ncbi:MAG: amidohydrolase family protein [Anaerolineae bacterium]
MKDKVDLVISGGLLCKGDGIMKADIAIGDGLIVEVEKEIVAEPSCPTIDASGKLILPGVIDVHVHPVYLDDMQTLSQSAAWGGVTALIHYIYVNPGTKVVEALKDAIEEGSRTSLLDFGLHASLFDVDNQMAEIPEVMRLGVTSFKMFMAYAKLGRAVSDRQLLEAMEAIAAHQGLAIVHAENGVMADYLEEKIKGEGYDSPAVYSRTRPNVVEAEAVFRVISLASVVGCPLYLPHLSAKESLAPVRMAREKGQSLYAETCPQYLSLTEAELERQGTLAKIAPPLRKEEDVEALWRALREGLIDVIGSDHAPKAKDRGEDILAATFGAPGVETVLTVTYDEGVNKGKIPPCHLVRFLSENPAKIFGLYPQKGAIEVGSDADLIIFDPNFSHTISQTGQHSKAGYTLYEGRSCLGAPVLSMQRGKVLLEEGKLKGSPGQGQFLKTAYASQ